MKKLILILSLMVISLTSCNKDNPEPKDAVEAVDCKCGEVIEKLDDVVLVGDGYIILWYEIRIKNSCSGNVQKRTIYVGKDYPGVKTPNIQDVICSFYEW